MVLAVGHDDWKQHDLFLSIKLSMGAADGDGRSAATAQVWVVEIDIAHHLFVELSESAAPVSVASVRAFVLVAVMERSG